MNDNISTPRKRPRRVDEDATPRQPLVAPGDSISNASSVSSSSVSQRSARSATKQFGALELSQAPNLEFALFNDQDPAVELALPASLQATRNQLFRFSISQSVVPEPHKEEIKAIIRGPEAYTITDAIFYAEATEAQRVGPVHPVDDFRQVVHATHKCMRKRASEAIWNAEVHGEVLRLALRHKRNSMQGGLVNYAVATSATVHRSLLKGGGAKMIDYAIFIDTENDAPPESTLKQHIQGLRKRSRTGSVNATDYDFLLDNPIALSIESKRSEGFEAATLQIGTWHAAHWTFLERVVHDSSDLDALGFLPGLIVQGAEWYFVASTRQDDKTILWTRQSIGSTQYLLGTYRVVRALQYLAWWSAEVYWPWFCDHVLAMPSVDDG
ncbi:hypothetical protein LY76DRAFT_528409 [Colletotrichum caudatum]|nr:hypothetical protein LY76DRAFT_528409 [Colletotrichum caudatum]